LTEDAVIIYGENQQLPASLADWTTLSSIFTEEDRANISEMLCPTSTLPMSAVANIWQEALQEHSKELGGDKVKNGNLSIQEATQLLTSIHALKPFLDEFLNNKNMCSIRLSRIKRDIRLNRQIARLLFCLEMLAQKHLLNSKVFIRVFAIWKRIITWISTVRI
jgi:hypothetical protein